MKAVWKGILQFGLVRIPIKLYSATQKQTLGFNILHAKCNTPVNYQRYCPKCKKKIEWEQIVKGMRLSDGSYFVMSPDNLKKLRPEKTDEINVVECVADEELPPVYYDGHYYIAPQKVTDKAYYVMRDALQQTGTLAIAKFVMRDREHICAIQPFEDVLLLSTLNYQYEVRDFTRIEELTVSVSPRISAKELKLAETLIKKLRKKTFDMKAFKDTFAQQLRERIKKKAKGKQIAAEVVQEKRVARRAKKETSLLDTLEESVKGFKRPRVSVSKTPVARAKPAKKNKKVVAKKATRKARGKKR